MPIEQNVPRFEIAMQDAFDVRVLHRDRHLRHQHHGTAWLVAQSWRSLEQTAAASEFHAEKRQPLLVLAHFVNGQNVWMIEARRRFGFPPETRQRLLRIGVIG